MESSTCFFPGMDSTTTKLCFWVFSTLPLNIDGTLWGTLKVALVPRISLGILKIEKFVFTHKWFDQPLPNQFSASLYMGSSTCFLFRVWTALPPNYVLGVSHITLEYRWDFVGNRTVVPRISSGILKPQICLINFLAIILENIVVHIFNHFLLTQ